MTDVSTGKSRGLIQIDPRTKLLILLLGTVFSLSLRGLWAQVALCTLCGQYGIICGAYRSTVKAYLFYVLLVGIHMGGQALGGSFGIMLTTFSGFLRMVLPCMLLGGVLISTTRISELLAAMERMGVPKSLSIPIAVMLRYFPSIREDWRAIRDAMRLRDVGFSQPMRVLDCIYVPLMMSASRISDELSAASVVRGIERPGRRTSLRELRIGPGDFGIVLLFCLAGISILLLTGRGFFA